MSHYEFEFCGELMHARASGALYWPAQNVLCVSDLHFGKAQRYAGFGASTLPPYDTQDTLLRLDQDIAETSAGTLVCLGDSFDRIGASDDLDSAARDWITRLQAGRTWIWIEGNHDPGPVGLGGAHLSEFHSGTLLFRHIAETAGHGEISGHYHPKLTLNLKGRALTRRCFIYDQKRLIMPAYGTYTGGLSVQSEPLGSMLDRDAICILTGSKAMPVPRSKQR